MMMMNESNSNSGTRTQRRSLTASLAEPSADMHSFHSSHGSFNSGDRQDSTNTDDNNDNNDNNDNDNDNDNNEQYIDIDIDIDDRKIRPTKDCRRPKNNKFQELLLEVQRRSPYFQKLVKQVRKVSPRYRILFVLFWVLSKFLIMYSVLYILHHTSSWTFGSNIDSSISSVNGGRLMASNMQQSSQSQSQAQQSGPLKILYIVTSLAEFDSGRRATTKGKDRLGHVLLPVLVDSVESIVHHNSTGTGTGSSTGSSTGTSTPPPPLYQVDVYLILAYQLSDDRRQLIRDRLPSHVGLEIWDDSCPVGYDKKGSDPNKIADNTRALARNHRYVIKDKLPYYDLFLAWEDDMRITGDHVQLFLWQSAALDRLRYAAAAAAAAANTTTLAAAAAADDHVPEQQQQQQHSSDLAAHQRTKFFGPMTRPQLDRLIPGFVRVEVLLNETEHGAQQPGQLDPIPLDHNFAVTYTDATATTATTTKTTTTTTATDTEERHFDPKPCCHVVMSPNDETPSHPEPRDVVVWETSIKAMSARQLPQLQLPSQSQSSDSDSESNAESESNSSLVLDWVVLLPGPGKRLPKEKLVGGYWSGRDGGFGNEVKPSPGMPDLIAQQGGWMATREQILRLHTGQCQGAFVPPYDEPIYRADGQESMNVEFYSGGYQFFTGVLGGCNMQRIVSLHPDHFSKHFIYHVANNKQRQLAARRMVRADDLFGQLNTVKKRAEQAKAAMMMPSSS